MPITWFNDEVKTFHTEPLLSPNFLNLLQTQIPNNISALETQFNGLPSMGTNSVIADQMSHDRLPLYTKAGDSQSQTDMQDAANFDSITNCTDDLVSSTTEVPTPISTSPPVEVTEGADNMINSFLQDLTAGRDVPVSEIMPDVDSSSSDLKDFSISNINFPDEFLKIQVSLSITCRSYVFQ